MSSTTIAVLAAVVAVAIGSRLLQLNPAAQRAAWRQWRTTGRAVPGWGPEWAWSSPPPAAPAGEAPSGRGATVVCLTCRLHGWPAASAPEAEFLAGVHNELHHVARPVATTVPFRGSDDSGGAA